MKFGEVIYQLVELITRIKDIINYYPEKLYKMKKELKNHIKEYFPLIEFKKIVYKTKVNVDDKKIH